MGRHCHQEAARCLRIKKQLLLPRREVIAAIQPLAVKIDIARGGVTSRLSEARYRAGVDSFLVSLDAQRTAYAARQQLVTTRLAQASNLVELDRRLGGGLN